MKKAKEIFSIVLPFAGVAVLLYIAFLVVKQHAANTATQASQDAMASYDTAEANQLNQISQQRQVEAVINSYLHPANPAG
jgi:arginine exporter protein ArgO